jgi:nucleotide-binding universal stress UspA family protein
VGPTIDGRATWLKELSCSRGFSVRSINRNIRGGPFAPRSRWASNTARRSPRFRSEKVDGLFDALRAGSMEDSDAAAARHLVEFAKDASGVTPANAVVLDGAIVPTILRAARDLRADLLVLGLHGPPSGFQELLLSPVTERVIFSAPCPVLAVARPRPERAETSNGMFRTIVCGVDRSEASRRALDQAMHLGAESGGRLIVVHALADMNDEAPAIAAGHFNAPD